MTRRRHGEDMMLVRLESFVRICCDAGFRRGQVASEPVYHRDAADQGDQLINNHRTADHPRFTILPTISVVPAWEEKEHTRASNYLRKYIGEGLTTHVRPNQYTEDYRYSYDDTVAGDLRHHDVIVPTPTLQPSTPFIQPRMDPGLEYIETGVYDEEDNISKGFMDAFSSLMKARKVGQNSEILPSLRQEVVRGGEAVVSGMPPHVQEGGAMVTLHQSEGLSPVLQACIGLGVLVIVMVVLFHLHHFRRDCLTDRRVLRRRSRLYNSRQKCRLDGNDEVTENENEDIENSMPEEKCGGNTTTTVNAINQEEAKPARGKKKKGKADRAVAEAVLDDVSL